MKVHAAAIDQGSPTLSVVLPAFREEAGIERMIEALQPVLEALPIRFEVIVVDDGSADRTFDVVAALCKTRTWLRGIRLSRNFGKEGALLAGLAAAAGRAVITMDADLQHPPEVISRMYAEWREGAQVVNAIKIDRSHDSPGYASIASYVTRVLTRLTGISLKAASDFKLLDRQVVDILVADLPERERFFRGLSQWVGFRQVDIPFKVAASTRIERNWTVWALMRLTATALVSFTAAPLQLVTVLGCITLMLAVIVGTDGLVSWVQGRSASGFATLILTVLILGSFIMISLGILGMYVSKIYEEIKRRPAYLVAEACGGLETTGARSGADLHRCRHIRAAGPRGRSVFGSAKRPKVIRGEIPKKYDRGDR